MSRIEPNLLLALSTGLALVLMIMTASLYGEPGQGLRYAGTAAVCAGLFVPLNGLLMKQMQRKTPPLISPGLPLATLLAGGMPLLVIIGAAIPVFFPGHNYGLLIIIGAVIFGSTVESAYKAAKPRD